MINLHGFHGLTIDKKPPLPVRLRDALEHNDFSSIPTAYLPVFIPKIAKAVGRSSDELLLESLGFSIISQNPEQVRLLRSNLIRKKSIVLHSTHFTWQQAILTGTPMKHSTHFFRQMSGAQACSSTNSATPSSTSSYC